MKQKNGWGEHCKVALFFSYICRQRGKSEYKRNNKVEIKGEYSLDSSGTELFLVLILLILTAFFVASEFGIIRVRRTRIDQLIAEGNKNAKNTKKILDNLDGYLSACQLGITITSLGLGWIGEPTVAGLLTPIFGHFNLSSSIIHTMSFVIAFTIITFMEVVLGELAPKSLAIQKAEKITLLFSRPLIIFHKVMFPVIWALNSSANSLIRLIGLKPASEEEEHTVEEVKMIVSNSSNLEPDEQQMLAKIFDFHERFLREIMIHRKEMDCIYLSDSIEENVKYTMNSTHSRLPVCGEDKDDILGYVTVKEIYKAKEEGNLQIEKILRKLPKLYETTSIKKALRYMQENKHQMAIVIDEYGGVSGLVTLEDILEVIVGEIQDEFDIENESFKLTKEGTLVDATVLIDDVNERFGLDLEEIDGIDTIGGYILTKIDLPPKVGSEFDLGKYMARIIEVDDLIILSLLFFENPHYKEEDSEEKE